MRTVVLAITAALALAGCAVSTDKEAAPAASTAAAKAKAGQIGDGTYEIPADMKPGKYKSGGPADKSFPSCYFARLKGTSGDLNDIIANGNPTGPTVITVAATDKAFQTNGCLPWVLQKK